MIQTHYQLPTTLQPLLHQNPSHPLMAAKIFESCPLQRVRCNFGQVSKQTNEWTNERADMPINQKQITSLICDKFSASFANFHLTFFVRWISFVLPLELQIAFGSDLNTKCPKCEMLPSNSRGLLVISPARLRICSIQHDTDFTFVSVVHSD